MTTTAPLTGAPLAPLRPIAPSPHSEPETSTRPSREPQRLSNLAPLEAQTRRVLDLDIETVAAGFGDPQWVPNRTTVWAYAWADVGEVTVEALPVADFYNKAARREFLRPLFDAITEAGTLTGHNLTRFDLGVLNSECLLLGLPTLTAKLVEDTIKLPKSRGFKKGQDNLGHALGVKAQKLPLSWAEWEEAYGEPDLATVKERCASDVAMHLEVRAAMAARGIRKPARVWTP